MTLIPLKPLHERLAQHCLDAYTDDYLSMHEHIDNKETGVQCLFLTEEKQLIICYRGSDELSDWRWNIHMTQNEYPKGSGCYMHAGFLVQWVSVECEFKEKLRKLLELNVSTNEFEEIVFCGHSAGGQCCIAAYSCRKLLEEYNLPVKVITFASPRVGDMNFKNNLESFADCTRIVLDRDVVTRVPVFGYEHVGKPIQIRDDCILERETSTWEHFHWMVLGARKKDFGVLDHAPWNYYSKIRKWLFETGPEVDNSGSEDEN